MITIVPYNPAWPAEFRAIATGLRQVLGELALRIDHIGSTAVPGLPAKDIVDIQVTVQSLDPQIERRLALLGYRRLEHITQDHVPPDDMHSIDNWRKWLFKPPADSRRVNLHVRVAGRANQRYPLLFRDYLRAHAGVAQAYAQVKAALAKYHPDDIYAYCDIKDPVCDIIIGGAEAWALATGWDVESSEDRL